jgi:hypothetical protein
MALYTPKKVVLNWYQYDASFSIELMVTFVDGIEKQTAESVANYKAVQHTADRHQGLDRESWDLENIFGEYFPSLQRRSAFLTVWSYFEHQLDQLCLFYQSERKVVARLQGLKASEEWDVLKTLQRIRNVIVHGDGKLQGHQGKPKDGVIADMKKVGFLTGDEEIIIAEGFLSHVVHICNKYFKLIEKAVYAEQGFTSPDYNRS